MNENSIRSIAGTGAVVNVFCGFIPGRVSVTNIDSAAGDTMSFYVGMPDGSAFKTAGGARTKITNGGISVLRDPVFGYGFSIGADAAVNIAGQRMLVEAQRGGEGNQEPSYSSLPTGA